MLLELSLSNGLTFDRNVDALSGFEAGISVGGSPAYPALGNVSGSTNVPIVGWIGGVANVGDGWTVSPPMTQLSAADPAFAFAPATGLVVA